ncbi:MAG: hypothetical protein M3362_00235 [Acidobacteriota bacterium]|nr:hypothetical protein [Acidobacteriota bacterium]
MANEPTQAPVESPSREKKTQWWRDPPKLTPIIISMVALAFGGLSWWESHKSRRINEEVNRPILALVSIKTTQGASDTYEKEDDIHLSVGTKVVNVGKSTAIIEKASVSADILSDIEELCYTSQLEEPTGSYKGTNLLPNVQTTFSRNLDVMQSCRQLSVWLFQVRLKLEYTDAVSGNKFSQAFDEFVSMSPEDVLREAKNEEEKNHKHSKKGQ